MFSLLIIALLGSVSGSAQAASVKNPSCHVVDSFSKQSVVCGTHETELFLKPQEKIVGITLTLSDPKRGVERDIDVRSISLNAVDVTNGKYLKNKNVMKDIKKVEKEWGAQAQVQIQRIEVAKAAHFYAAQDFKTEIKPTVSTESRSVASTQPEAQHSGVMRAKLAGKGTK